MNLFYRWPTPLLATWLSVSLLWIAPLAAIAQDATQAMPFANPQLLSPTMAGLVEGSFGARFSHRYQRATDTEGYNTSTLSFDLPINTRLYTGGAGITAQNDITGGMQTTSISAAAAYQLPLGIKIRYNRVRIGASFGLLQRRVIQPSLIFADQFNAQQGGFFNPTADIIPNLSTNLALDVSIGATWYRTQQIKGNLELNHFFGAAIQHINSPSLTFTAASPARYSPRYTVFGGGKLRTRSAIDYNANAVYFNQNSSQSMAFSIFVRNVFYDRGVLFGKENAAILAGINGRLQMNTVTASNGDRFRTSGLESVAPFIGLEYDKTFVFGFAYDFVVNQQGSAVSTSYGGLMVSIGYLFGGQNFKGSALPIPLF
jgi:type IX secretion system PorP/SprF family membrane protein